MSQQRLDYLDMAKGVGIFLVILGHIEYIQESTLKWIFSFHMPLFFVVAGILAYVKREEKRSLKEAIRKRAKGTLVPYLSFSLILLTMSTLDFFFFPDRITGEALGQQFLDMATGYGIHILWFLPAYFLGNVFFLVLIRGTGKKVWLSGLCIFFLTAVALGLIKAFDLENYVSMEGGLLWRAGMNLFLTLLRGICSLPFLLLGWHLGKWEEKVSRRRSWLFSFLLLPGAFLALRLRAFDLHYLHVDPAHYLAAACSCTGLLGLLRSLPANRSLSYLGRNSLVIMCTHASLFVVYYVSLGMFFVKKFIPMTQPVFNLGVTVFVCLAEIPIIWFFNRYGKHLLGRTV